LASTDSIAKAFDTLKNEYKISALDVVISNAAMGGPTSKLAEAPVSELQKFIDVNAYGSFELFKAALPLLRSSNANGKAKFVLISSAGGSLTTMYDFSMYHSFQWSLCFSCQIVNLWDYVLRVCIPSLASMDFANFVLSSQCPYPRTGRARPWQIS
jgi:hypothetical protein